MFKTIPQLRPYFPLYSSIAAQQYRVLAVLLALPLLTACFDKDKAPEITLLKLVATHAFDTAKPVTDIAFIANTQAAWLGRVFYLDNDGALNMTDIEGRDQIKIGSDEDPATNTPLYKQIISVLNTDNTGVILALGHNPSTLNGFQTIEDQDTIFPLTFNAPDQASGPATNISISRFCASTSPIQDVVYSLDANGNGQHFTIIKDQDNLRVTGFTPIPEIKNAVHCSVSGDVLIFTDAKQSYQIDLNSPNAATKLNGGFGASNMIVPLNLQNYVAALSDTAQTEKRLILKSLNGTENYGVEIADGLSIMGVSNIRSIHATDQNYGGAAFSDGVVALTDNDAPRIVFLSTNYLAGQIKQTPPVVSP